MDRYSLALQVSGRRGITARRLKTSSIRPPRASMTRIPCRAANRRVGEADRRRRFEPGRP